MDSLSAPPAFSQLSLLRATVLMFEALQLALTMACSCLFLAMRLGERHGWDFLHPVPYLPVSFAQLKLWNSKSKNCVRTMPCRFGLACAFAPGNRHGIVVCKDGYLQLFDLASGDLLEEHEAHEVLLLLGFAMVLFFLMCYVAMWLPGCGMER